MNLFPFSPLPPPSPPRLLPPTNRNILVVCVWRIRCGGENLYWTYDVVLLSLFYPLTLSYSHPLTLSHSISLTLSRSCQWWARWRRGPRWGGRGLSPWSVRSLTLSLSHSLTPSLSHFLSLSLVLFLLLSLALSPNLGAAAGLAVVGVLPTQARFRSQVDRVVPRIQQIDLRTVHPRHLGAHPGSYPLQS